MASTRETSKNTESQQIDARQIELLKEQIELLKEEYELLKNENRRVIENNASLKAQVDMLEEDARISRENYRLLEDNYEWQKSNLALSERKNRELISLLNVPVSSEEPTNEDIQFKALQAQMLKLQESLHNTEINMTEKLIQQKQELEGKIEKRIVDLFQEHQQRQTNALHDIKQLFESNFHALNDNNNVNELTKEIYKLNGYIAEQQNSLTDKTSVNDESLTRYIQDEIDKAKFELNGKIEQIDHELEDGGAIQEVIGELEEKIFAEIKKEQAVTVTIVDHLSLLEQKQNALEDQYEPMHEIYQIKRTKLIEQKAILENEKSRIFYNTVYKAFSAKLVAAIILSSELVKHDDTKIEKIGKFTGSMVGAVVGSVPVFGNLLDSLTSFTIEESVGAVKGYFQSKKSINTTNSIISIDKAIKISELIARRLTQDYIDHDCNIENKLIEKNATQCVRSLYNFIKSGKLLEYKDADVEEKVTILINDLKHKKVIEKGLKLSSIEDADSDEEIDEAVIINRALASRSHSERVQRRNEHARYNDLSIRAKHKSTSEMVEVTKKYSLSNIERLKKDHSETRQELLETKTRLAETNREVALLKKMVEKISFQSEAPSNASPTTAYTKTHLFANSGEGSAKKPKSTIMGKLLNRQQTS